MRVIAGSAKGRTLASVPGDSTRPITDRTKAALFSILTSAGMLEGKRYLDLFGGTGAVGIEALSRDAAEAVFCERDRKALETLRRNLQDTGLADRGRVVPGDAFAYLARPDLPAFDVIYIAPPQYKGLWLRGIEAGGRAAGHPRPGRPRRRPDLPEGVERDAVGPPRANRPPAVRQHCTPFLCRGAGCGCGGIGRR